MNAIGGGNGGIWGMRRFNHSDRRRGGGGGNKRPGSSSKPPEATGGASFRFPIKQAATAASLALAGDTLAQLRERWAKSNSLNHQHPQPIPPDSQNKSPQDASKTLIQDHNWLRALRMTSYGFLLYGPGSYAWYQFLDRCMPKQTVQNVFTKVLLNQIVLGPCVIAIVFAWNNLWLGKIAELPKKYQRDALPTLLSGFRFWIPVSILNFWVVPLQVGLAISFFIGWSHFKLALLSCQLALCSGISACLQL